MDSSSYGGSSYQDGFQNQGAKGGSYQDGKSYQNMEDPFKDSNQKAHKEKKKYPLWSQIQEMEDWLHKIYSEGSDFAEIDTSTLTNSELRMLPFRLIWTYGCVLIFIALAYLWSFVGYFFGLSNAIVLPVFSLIVGMGVLYPAHVVYSMKQYVSGGQRTTRFYKHVKSGWKAIVALLYLVSTIALGVTYVMDYSVLSYGAQEYTGFGAKLINEIDAYQLQEGFEKSGYAMVGFSFIFFLYSVIITKKATKLQRERTIAMKKQLSLDTDTAASIMNGDL